MSSSTYLHYIYSVFVNPGYLYLGPYLSSMLALQIALDHARLSVVSVAPRCFMQLDATILFRVLCMIQLTRVFQLLQIQGVPPL